MQSALLTTADWLAVQALRLRGFRRVYLDTTVGKVHCLDAKGGGNLPTLVLFHGLSSSASDYSPTLRLLKPHFKRLIAVDLPGHGFSEPVTGPLDPKRISDALSDSLADFVPEGMVLFGNSLGGLTAIRVANRSPNNVKAILLASPAGAPLNSPEMSSLVALFRHDSHADAVVFMRRAVGRRLPILPMLAWGVRQRLSRPSVKAWVDGIQAKHMLSPDEVKKITVPTMLFWGSSDEILPPTSVDFFLENLGNLQQIIQPEDFGHAPHIDNPRKFAKMIVEFVSCQFQNNALH